MDEIDKIINSFIKEFGLEKVFSKHCGVYCKECKNPNETKGNYYDTRIWNTGIPLYIFKLNKPLQGKFTDDNYFYFYHPNYFCSLNCMKIYYKKTFLFRDNYIKLICN